jgi:hypothetical protein
VSNKRGHAPVVFDEASFDADTKEGNSAGADVAKAARRAYERDGVPADDLRRCEAEGSDGTLLPHCLKVYMPAPAGRFGMVFQLEIVNREYVTEWKMCGSSIHYEGGSCWLSRPTLTTGMQQEIPTPRRSSWPRRASPEILIPLGQRIAALGETHEGRPRGLGRPRDRGRVAMLREGLPSPSGQLPWMASRT